LWDAGASICVGDRHIANWLVGQVLDENADMDKMVRYAREIGADEEEYKKALGEVTRMPQARFEKVCQALFLIARQLSHLALGNVQQARAISERRQAEAALIEADRRKDEFLAMLSHELRNPMAPIRNAVQIMRLTGGGDLTTLRQREIIDRQVTHMARLLDDLLDVSRITRGKIHLKMETIDLRDVVGRAVETERVLIDGRHQVLIYSCPGEPLRLTGDPTRLEQVICNLLNNAIKYSEEGGKIWLQVAARDSVKAASREAVVVVHDEGIGIAPEMLPRVFDIFAQASQSLDRSQGGLGLGLTLVQRLVEMHGGSVEAASEGPGKGSTFTVHLPLAA
jgi:signal transduction histidine kinase